MTLALDLDLTATAQRDVQLLLAILPMIVLRVLMGLGRHVDHLHAERGDAELRARPLERAA